MRLLQLLQHALRLMVPQPQEQDRAGSLWQHLVASRDRDRVLQVLVVCAERVVSSDSSDSECLRERVWLVTALNRRVLAKASHTAFPAGHADELREGVASALAALDAVAFNIAFSHSSPEQLAFPEFQPVSVAADPTAAVASSAATKVIRTSRLAVHSPSCFCDVCGVHAGDQGQRQAREEGVCRHHRGGGRGAQLPPSFAPCHYITCSACCFAALCAYHPPLVAACRVRAVPAQLHPARRSAKS